VMAPRISFLAERGPSSLFLQGAGPFFGFLPVLRSPPLESRWTWAFFWARSTLLGWLVALLSSSPPAMDRPFFPFPLPGAIPAAPFFFFLVDEFVSSGAPLPVHFWPEKRRRIFPPPREGGASLSDFQYRAFFFFLRQSTLPPSSFSGGQEDRLALFGVPSGRIFLRLTTGCGSFFS